MIEKSILEVIDDMFLKELREASSNPEAFHRASVRFEENHGFSVPFSYESFRKKKRKKKTRD